MPAHDATAEALWSVLFGRSTVGYAVLGVRRTNGGAGVVWERHALPVEEPAAWTGAVEMLVRHGLRSEAWPFVASTKVLRSIGTSAFSPGGKTASLRSWQSLVAITWTGAPADEALGRFVAVGGHVVSASTIERFGLLSLEVARPLGALTALTNEVAATLGATPLGYDKALPIPGVNGAAFMTDPARALAGQAVSDEAIVRAGLRTSWTTWSS